jgi:hypothetical protein
VSTELWMQAGENYGALNQRAMSRIPHSKEISFGFCIILCEEFSS